jgi:hypothetical protein
MKYLVSKTLLAATLTNYFTSIFQTSNPTNVPHVDTDSTLSYGTRTDYSVGPWDYSACATRHLMAWGARTTMEKYSDRKLYMSCTM